LAELEKGLSKVMDEISVKEMELGTLTNHLKNKKMLG